MKYIFFFVSCNLLQLSRMLLIDRFKNIHSAFILSLFPVNFYFRNSRFFSLFGFFCIFSKIFTLYELCYFRFVYFHQKNIEIIFIYWNKKMFSRYFILNHLIWYRFYGIGKPSTLKSFEQLTRQKLDWIKENKILCTFFSWSKKYNMLTICLFVWL